MTTVVALRERFTVDDVDLATLGLVGVAVSGLDEIAEVRGSDAPYTGIDGEQYLAKLRGSKPFVLHVYALGSDADGNVLTDNRRHARANLDGLYAKLGLRGQRSVSRSMPDGTTRTCLAEVLRTERAPDPTGGMLYSIVVTLRNADGVWYGSPVVDTRVITATQVSFDLTHPGTAATHRISFDLTGPITVPRITNQTTGAWWEGPDVLTGTHLIVDAYTFAATLDGGDVAGTIVHGGAIPFMLLVPGVNALVVSATSAAGSLTSTLTPSFF